MPKPKFNNHTSGYGGHWSTKDVTIASLVASFGIRWRGKAPIIHIVHANRLISSIDKSTGKIDHVKTLGYYFDYQTDHPVHGIITGTGIAAAYDKRAIETEREEGNFINPRRIDTLNRLMKSHSVTDALYREVCQMADAMENLMVITAGVSELIGDPLIQMSRKLRKGNLDILRPMETEPVAQRFMEKFNANSH